MTAQHETTYLADSLSARVVRDTGPGSTSLGAFVDPHAALRAALALQHDTAGLALRGLT